MSIQCHINHIRAALQIAQELAKENGTEFQRQKIEYAERILKIIEEIDYPKAQREADRKWQEYAGREMEQFGTN